MGLFTNNLFKTKTDNPFSVVDLPFRTMYEKLEEYYDNNGLYDNIQNYSEQQLKWVEKMKGLRTCVNRSVEFYTAQICKKDLQVITNNEQVKDSLEQFYTWSNLEFTKRKMVRQLSLLGDLFIKVVNTKTKIYTDIIHPKYITEFKTDHRNYLIEVRIDIPIREDEQDFIYTEYWTKEYFSVYKHKFSENTKIEDLGTPIQFTWLKQLGIDFIPIVYVKFRDVPSKERGASCVEHAILKIDDVNRMATRLESLLYRHNKPIFAVSSSVVDESGRPLPPPEIEGVDNDESAEMEDGSLIYMPGMTDLKSLIPNINYEQALKILQAAEQELEKDLPELKYYSLPSTDISGTALRTLLLGAIDRLEEAKSNFKRGLERAGEIALTVGKNTGVFKISGSYENGDFEHDLILGDPFAQTAEEQANLTKLYVDSGIPVIMSMKLAGYSDEVIVETQTLLDKQNEQNLASFITNFNNQ